MFKTSITVLLLASLIACGADETEKKEPKLEKPADPSDLIKIEGDHYMEYYPGGKQLKFEGYQDDEKQRHGKWVYYREDGLELSMTMYHHGKKHGHSIVKYPNGGINYVGEYDMDTKIGIWKSYDAKGKLIEEKDYGNPTN